MDLRAAITPVVYDHLRLIARGRMGEARSSPTLQPTALVNEALAKLLGADPSIHDENHLVSLAVEAMRQVWIDHARARTAAKRGGGAAPAEIKLADLPDHSLTPDRLLDVDHALEGIERTDPELGLLLKLRLFTDLGMNEISALAGLSVRTAERRWRYGAALLRRHLG